MSTPVDQDHSLSITKSYTTTPTGSDDASGASGVVDHAGQEIDYTITVSNTGNETLTGIEATAFAGLAVCSHNREQLATAQFADVQLKK